MTVARPRTYWHPILLVSFVAPLLGCSSSSSSNGGTGGSGSGGSGGAGGGGALDLSGFGQSYKLTDNEVSGWVQAAAADSFSLYDSTNLWEKIDGPADGYISRGMKFAYYETLDGPGDLLNCVLVAMAFDTAANAKSMVDYKVDLQGATTPIPGYDTSVALGSEALTGLTAYASFGALYLEVGVDGYGFPPDLDQASNDAAAFLKAMEAKPKL
ncbi:MAG: hypothetical protein JXP73_17205 [Deltaproteobacteria bacterium]|nr:hypothetical protein [Deltaproteobacteria bacterium]